MRTGAAHSSSYTLNSRRPRRRISSSGCCHYQTVVSLVVACVTFSIGLLSPCCTWLSLAEAAAASTTFSGRRATVIAATSILRRPTSSSSHDNLGSLTRGINNGGFPSRSRHSSSLTSWPLRLSSPPSSLGSYDELCDSLQHLQDTTTTCPSRRRSSLSSQAVLLASSKTAVAPRAAKKGNRGGNKSEAVVAADGQSAGSGGAGYDDLTPLGRCVYGSIEVAVVTATDFVSGCFGGYMIGVVTDIPRLLFRSVEQGSSGSVLQSSSSSPFWSQFSSRMSRMHGKSWRWGKEWGTISAVFGASRVATKVIRGGKEDEWSTVLSSMAAGAYFARKEGPQAMVKGALLYGGFVYLLSGNLALKKKPFQYEEKPIDF